MNILRLYSGDQKNVETANKYPLHSCLNLLKNKPQINADECILIHKSSREFGDQYRAHGCLGLLENKPQINADERRLIKSDEETYFLHSNSILNPHIFNMTYSSQNSCL